MKTMMYRIAIIHNPTAGRRRQKRVHALMALLETSGHHVTLTPTGKSGDARQFALAAKDIDILIVAGGDGTVNEVVEGLCAHTTDAPLPAIGFLPLGTMNVLARELDLPQTPQDLVQMLERGNRMQTFPGISNDRRFFLMASVGLDARAVAGVSSKMKKLIGSGAYVLAAIKALRAVPPLYNITIDGAEKQARTIILARARYYGGPFILAPEAGMKTPILNVVLFHSYGFFAALKYGLYLAIGKLDRLSDVEFMTAREVEISNMSGEPVQLDGDIMTALPLHVTLETRAISFLIP